MTTKTRAILAAARLANLPGVACHVVTGCLLAWWLGGSGDALPWVAMGLLALAGVLLCVAGNLLNDWHDRAWDAKFRPERALPAGHFRAETFFIVGIVALLGGVALAFVQAPLAGGFALAIAGCIAIYTRWHKRAAWTVLPLAMCRALLPAMGAAAIGGGSSGVIAVACAALFLWVIGLSLDARGESTGGARRALPWWLLVAAIALPAAYWMRDTHFIWIGLAPACAWLVMVRGPLRHTAKMRVSALLAGLPLVDFASLAAAWQMHGSHSGVLLIPLTAFAAGRLCQRIAAAT